MIKLSQHLENQSIGYCERMGWLQEKHLTTSRNRCCFPKFCRAKSKNQPERRKITRKWLNSTIHLCDALWSMGLSGRSESIINQNVRAINRKSCDTLVYSPIKLLKYISKRFDWLGPSAITCKLSWLPLPGKVESLVHKFYCVVVHAPKWRPPLNELSFSHL